MGSLKPRSVSNHGARFEPKKHPQTVKKKTSPKNAEKWRKKKKTPRYLTLFKCLKSSPKGCNIFRSSPQSASQSGRGFGKGRKGNLLGRHPHKRRLILHPQKLTWNLRIHPWKRKIIFQTTISRFHVNFWGCIFCWQEKYRLLTSPQKIALQSIVSILTLWLGSIFISLAKSTSEWSLWMIPP